MATKDALVTSDRLDSWKEIAAYLKRDESTVRRWEDEGLPVHRLAHKKKASVYAYRSELDSWWQDGPQPLAEKRPAGAQRSRVAVAIIGVSVLVILVTWWMVRFRENVPTRVSQFTTLPGWEDSPTWSADGRSIAYAADDGGKLHIYVQKIGSRQAIRLSESDDDEAQPAWSPDGSQIAFVSRSESVRLLTARTALTVANGMDRWSRWHPFFIGTDGDIWIRASSGGPRRRIAQDAYFPAWAPDGKKLAYVAWHMGRWSLFVQDVDRPSEPRSLAIEGLPESTWAIAHPAWSPDGKWIAFTGGGTYPLRVYIVPSAGGQTRAMTSADSQSLMPSWSPDGRSLFFSSDSGGSLNLWKGRFENGSLGPAIQVTVGSGDDLQGCVAPRGSKIAFSSERTTSDIWELDLTSGETTSVVAETTLEDNARPSPDGRFLAFASNRLAGNHLWLLDRGTGRLTRVTSTPAPTLQQYSFWSPNGRYLFYWTQQPPEPTATVWEYEIASGTTRKIYESPAGGHFCLSADGGSLFALAGDLIRVDLTSGKASVLLARPTAAYPACSPDGRWIAVQGHRGKDRDIWLFPIGAGTPRQLTSGPSEDSHPVWSADSHLVYFTRDHRDVFVVPVTGGDPKPVTRYRAMSVTLDYPALSGDGKKLLFTRSEKTGDIYLLDYRRD